MIRVLVLHSSPRPAELAVTRRLSTILVQRLSADQPDVEVIERDLAIERPGHVGASLLSGVRKQPGERTPAEAGAVAAAEAMIAELFAADILVIGAPMYNFGIPSVLKSWIDNVSLAGRTFRYDAQGKAHGLMTGKRAYVITSRGGEYGDAGPEAGNFADSHVRVAFALLGIHDLHVIAADWQALFPEARRDGFEIAHKRIIELVPARDR